ncbi:MAG: hypothetical protein ACTSP4_11305 [Candidatus Hodarchaeales archaeon]
MTSEKTDYTPMELIEFLTAFNTSKSKGDANRIGKAIAVCSDSIEMKKRMFAGAFAVSNSDDEIDFIINLWAVAGMLEDDIEISRKILALRNVLKDPQLDSLMLEEWVRAVWAAKRIPLDILDFIAIDIRNHELATPYIKELLS